jgi:hypothetical protein
MFLRDAASKTQTAPAFGNIGYKDNFNYQANHGGESIWKPTFKIGTSAAWSRDDVPAFFFRTWTIIRSYPYLNEGRNVYGYGWGPHCDKWNPLQTVNLSGQKCDFECHNNNTSGSRAGTLYFYSQCINVTWYGGGVGGTPYRT